MEKPAKTFDYKEAEPRHYKNWESRGYFHADACSHKESFSIVIPPPNVTGSLHIGHALDNTLQDIFVRYMRMKGKNTLWMPGTDHAGIATQNVVEKQLLSEGTGRKNIGREAFLKKVWQWKEEYGGKIVNQLKRLGSSCDWARERFTMDEGLSRAVRKVFVDLYSEGLIYRDNYIINWCPRCQTALSDLEAEQNERDGKLYYIRYPLKEGKGFVTVATTRPETMLGDTALAVNPCDKKYKKLIGKTVKLPLTNREIPIIGDERVDVNFGTGALKITPAHDFNDFEISKTHSLERINIFTEDGFINENGFAYKNLKILDARQRVIDDLASQGLLEKSENYKLIIGSCHRCKTTVEPRMSVQWFVNVKPLAREAVKAVREQRTKIIPATWEKTYFDWMENIRDWCISRQLWWGHRIPAWYCKDCPHITVSMEDPVRCSECSSEKIERDQDVLDTWFSSALWPFSTMGWPDDTAELKTFYPTSLLITGFDIIFFWVARMMMMGLKFMKDVPFRRVYIHALVRDEYGQKMSKSKGNVVDPLEIMDKYGTDAFRFTLAVLSIQGRDISISEKRIEGYRNFVNKLWNASRFVLSGLDESLLELGDIANLNLSSEDRWILTKLNMAIESAESDLASYRFNDASSGLYKFVWHEFCDWYIELSKRKFYSGSDGEKKAAHTVLIYVLERTLKLLHPFMPFVTEEIWQKLPKTDDSPSIMISEFPKPDGFGDIKCYEEIEFLKSVISQVRTLRMENLIPPQKKINLMINSRDGGKIGVLKRFEGTICDLTACENLGFGSKIEGLCAKSIIEGIELTVPMAGIIDIESEKARLKKEIAKALLDKEFLEKRLSNEGYLKRAKEDLVEKDRQKLKEASEKFDKLNESLKNLEKLGG